MTSNYSRVDGYIKKWYVDIGDHVQPWNDVSKRVIQWMRRWGGKRMMTSLSKLSV